jgi:molecular chaperone GrpE
VPQDKKHEGNEVRPGGGENVPEEALQPVEEGEPASNEARMEAELMQREKEDLARFANENLLREFLPIFDNLERAVSHFAEGQESGAGLLEGVSLTLDQFQKALEKFGVVPVDAVGQPFDPAWHEAMGQVESAEHPPNTVVQEMQKGYILNDRLLRPALVLVAKAPSREQP